MKKAGILTALLVLWSAAMNLYAQNTVEADHTVLYAQKDSTDLFMDIYYPSDGSQSTLNGTNKTTVIFLAGGGFKSADKQAGYLKTWYKLLADQGLTIVSIDYRQGLKDEINVGFSNNRLIYKALQMATDDLFSATSYLVENAEELDINPDALILCGSSAGAMTVLQADWELCNGFDASKILPEGFRYAGVMAFAGGIFSRVGKVHYGHEPSPTLFFHGTDDKIVRYGRVFFLNLSLEGSKPLANEFKRKGYNYSIYRFDNKQHEISTVMSQTVNEQIRFIETNILGGKKRVIDAHVNDPSLRPFMTNNLKNMYRND